MKMRKLGADTLHNLRALRAVFGRAEPATGSVWASPLMRPVGILAALARDIVEGQLTLRAMSLVYTTLLSLVPLVAIGFSVLKGFGVHNQAEPLLLGLLEPLGEQAEEITQRIIGFVDNVQVGVLGFIGLMLLFYTVVSLLEKVERAFNYIWHAPNERSLAQKLRDYLALVVLGPVAVIGALGVTSSMLAASIVQDVAAFGPVGELMSLAGRLVPLLLVSITFTFVYMFIPNTRVRFLPALAGGIAAGLMWTVIGWGFSSFIVTSVRYAAVYSAFATLLLFMIWLYIVWLIVLVGSALSFYVQNPHYIGLRREPGEYSIETTERVALTAIWHIVRAYYRQAPAWSVDRLARHTNAPMPVLCDVLRRMERAGLVERAGEDQALYLPSAPPEETTLDAVRRAVRGIETAGVDAPRQETPAPVAGLMRRIDSTVADGLAGLTLKDFALADGAAAGDGGAAPPRPET